MYKIVVFPHKGTRLFVAKTNWRSAISGMKSNVADPDTVFLGHPDPDPGKPEPDPEKTEIGSGYLSTKFFFSQYLILSKIQFRKNNFFVFDFKCHKMFTCCKERP